MKLIAAVSRDWAIGNGPNLLFHIPEDLHRFQALTTGGTLVMGRKTMDTMPGGKPLPRRTTVVLTRNRDYRREDVLAVHSVAELLSLSLPEPVFVAGGGEIYSLLLPYCNEADLTLVDAAPQADVYFPRLDQDPQWTLTECSEEKRWRNLPFRFCKFEKL
jgi:dihydrofolate reductase